MKYKKGFGLAELPAAVLILIIVGSFVIVGTTLNDSLKATKTTERIANQTSVAFTNNTRTVLTYPWITSISIGNMTGTILSANYTLTSNTSSSSVLLRYSRGPGPAGEVKVNGNYWVYYTWTDPQDAYYAAENSSLGLLEITDNMRLLGLIIIMGAVISILLASFGGLLNQSGGL